MQSRNDNGRFSADLIRLLDQVVADKELEEKLKELETTLPKDLFNSVKDLVKEIPNSVHLNDGSILKRMNVPVLKEETPSPFFRNASQNHDPYRSTGSAMQLLMALDRLNYI